VLQSPLLCSAGQSQTGGEPYELSNFLFGSVNVEARPALRRNDIWELYAGTYIEANTNKIPPISQTKAHAASLAQASDAPRFIVWIDPFEGTGTRPGVNIRSLLAYSRQRPPTLM
jgi:hypothetical protein